MKSRVDLFGFPNNDQLNTECTNPDLSTNDVIDSMTTFNGGLKFQNATHADTVKQHERVMAGQSSQQQGQAKFAVE